MFCELGLHPIEGVIIGERCKIVPMHNGRDALRLVVADTRARHTRGEADRLQGIPVGVLPYGTRIAGAIDAPDPAPYTQRPGNPSSRGSVMNRFRLGMPLKYAFRTSTKEMRCSTPSMECWFAYFANSIFFASSGGVEA